MPKSYYLPTDDSGKIIGAEVKDVQHGNEGGAGSESSPGEPP